MTTSDVAHLARGYAAWQDGGIDAILPFLSEDIEWVQDPEFPGAQTFRGHRGVREWNATVEQGWVERRITVEDLIACGDGRVLALLQMDALGRTSGVQIRTPLAHHWTMRDGLAIRVQFFLDHRRARAATGC